MLKLNKKIISLGLISIFVLVNLLVIRPASSQTEIDTSGLEGIDTSALEEAFDLDELDETDTFVQKQEPKPKKPGFWERAFLWVTEKARAFLNNLVVKTFGTFINFALVLNEQLFSSDNAFIQSGWRISRDIANLGFILVIIVIAFATILRSEAYGVKKTLAKLITIALLVNFSLMACAALVSLTNIVTKTFLSAEAISSPGEQTMGENLASTMTDGDSENIRNDAGELFTDATLGSIFFIICLVIMAITLAAIFVMLLIRYVVLGILVILSPLAWLCAILPATETYWKQWWSQFLKWVLFMPIMAFFIYLTMLSGTSFGGGAGFATIANMFVKTGLLLMGLIVANSLGITGAKTFMALGVGAAAVIGGGIGAYTGGLVKYGGAKITRGLRENLGDKLAKAGKEGPKFTRWLSQPIRRTGERMFSGASGEKLAPLKPPTLVGAFSEQMKYYREGKGKKGIESFIKGFTPKTPKK